jgi:hypothetical protein
LYHALQQIDSEYVLFTLDDFFIHYPVKQNRVEQIIQWMKEDQNIACFYLYPFNKPGNTYPTKYQGFQKITHEYDLILQAQMGIWRKKALLKLIRKSESPWEFEEFGSKRASKTKWDFYSIYSTEPMKEEDAVIYYILALTLGYGVSGGKWLFNNKKLFEKYGIQADFSKRGSWKSREEILDAIKSKQNITEQFGQLTVKQRIRNALPDFVVRFYYHFR